MNLINTTDIWACYYWITYSQPAKLKLDYSNKIVLNNYWCVTICGLKLAVGVKYALQSAKFQ